MSFINKTEHAHSIGKQNKRLREMIAILTRHNVAKGMTPEKLRLILQDLGPVYIKLGQIMSMRSDMLPAEYCKELVLLRTNVKPMPIDEVRQVIKESCGADIEELFSEFDEEALGSASMAQVHKAVMHDGTVVVVKVQRAGIREKMSEDITLLKRAAGVLKFTKSDEVLNIGMILDELWHTSQEELDFLCEAKNAIEFYDNNEKIAYVSSPVIIKNLTTSHVLVMEYIGGCNINESDKLDAQGYDRNEIGTKLCENYVKQIIDDGFFHADPHPGNIKICDGKIVWIDLGMMGRLSYHDRTMFGQCIKAVAMKDIGGVKEAVLSIGKHTGEIDHSKLYSDIEDMFNRYGTLSIGSMDMSLIIEDFMKLAGENNIALPPGVSMLGRGVATIQGVIADISPQINFMQITANHMTNSVSKDVNFKDELISTARTAAESGKKLLDLPSLVSDAVKEAIKGRLKVNVELKASQDLKKTSDKLLKDLVSGIYASALLIGSSLLCLTDMQPQIIGIPIIGAVGFLVAFIAVLVLFIRRTKK